MRERHEQVEGRESLPNTQLRIDVGHVQVDGHDNRVLIQNIHSTAGTYDATQPLPTDHAEFERAISEIPLSDDRSSASSPLAVALSASSSVAEALVTWVVTDTSPLESKVDSLIAGKLTAAAMARLKEIVDGAAKHLAGLESHRSRLRQQARSLAEQIDRLAKECKKEEPVRPAAPVGSKSRAGYESSLAEYETKVSEFRRRKEILSVHRTELGSLEKEVQEIDSKIRAVQVEMERDKAESEEAIRQSRGRDLIVFVDAAREVCKAALSKPESRVTGYYALLTLDRLVPLLRGLLNEAWKDAERLRADIADRLKEETQTQYEAVWIDFLSRVKDLQTIDRANRDKLAKMEAALDELPQRELLGFVERIYHLTVSSQRSVPSFSREYEPTNFPHYAAELATSRSDAEQKIKQNISLFEEMHTLWRQTDIQRTKALAICSEIMADAGRKSAADALLVCNLVIRARDKTESGVTHAFLAAMIGTVQERLSVDVVPFVAKCQASQLGLRDAQELLANHPSAALLAARSSLLTHRGELDGYLQQIDQAHRDLLDRPTVLMNQHAGYLQSLSGSWLPPRQVRNALLMYRYKLIRPSLQCALPELMPLRQEAEKAAWSAILRALTSSALAAIVAIIAYYRVVGWPYGHELNDTVLVVLSVIAFCNAMTSLAAVVWFLRARRQFQNWSKT